MPFLPHLFLHTSSWLGFLSLTEKVSDTSSKLGYKRNEYFCYSQAEEMWAVHLKSLILDFIISKMSKFN